MESVEVEEANDKLSLQLNPLFPVPLEWDRQIECWWNEWMGRSWSLFVMKELKISRKMEGSGKYWSSNLSRNCENQSGFHLFERMIVAAASFVELKKIADEADGAAL
ncbi:hypothetical protein A2U01_0000383 [Trifolium medium]|uniref:Uncharacterized protein n=1 Tax=Trifolium medium TaxID=97028 RepID=A0A392LXF3_9FABA|nr:hypothetical protein [Trifolium medium]